MPLMQRATNSNDPSSVGNRMRSRRFRLFEQLLSDLPRPIRMLDIGGTAKFWENRGWAGNDDYQITVLNLEEEPRIADNLHPVVGDATNMEGIGEKSFDVAFSNSVIEHVFTLDAQMAMGRETQRVSKAYWVQTPNYYFPMEPHFHMVGWQWMPESMRVKLIRKRRCGWRGPCPDLKDAQAAVREVRLMKKGEVQKCFPGATVWGEKMFGLVKSWVAYDGFGKAINESALGDA